MINIDYKVNIDADKILLLGKSLRRIEQNIVKQSQDKAITKIWFQGAEPNFDVFFELYYDEISWFQFTLRGKSLSWDKKQSKFQTGNTNELSVNDAGYSATTIIENDNQRDDDFIYLVKSIIQTKTEEPVFVKALALFE